MIKNPTNTNLQLAAVNRYTKQMTGALGDRNNSFAVLIYAAVVMIYDALGWQGSRALVVELRVRNGGLWPVYLSD